MDNTRKLSMPTATTKHCNQCRKDKPATPEHFTKDITKKDGLQQWCRPCRKAYKQAARRTKRLKTEAKRKANPDLFEAERAVRLAIERNNLAPVESKLCVDCRKPAKTYYHYRGYAKEYRLDVVPLCHKCCYKHIK